MNQNYCMSGSFTLDSELDHELFVSLSQSPNEPGELTPVSVVQEDELVPVVVVEQRQQRSSDGRPKLQRELALALGGEAGRDEGDVQGAAEGRQRVHRSLVVEAEDGEDTAGVLGADCGRRATKHEQIHPNKTHSSLLL